MESCQVSDPTPMDRLRELELAPDLPRDQLREVIAAAVHEIQERLDHLEALAEARGAATPRRRPRERP
jgi:hypothetical protein